MVLRSLGYTVLEANSRGEAWSVCCEHQGTIHLILTDAVLGGDSFSEFLTQLQLICPQIHTLFFCDAAPRKLADRQSMPCECSFLQRPFRAEALAGSIKALLDSPKARAVSSFRD
jgi:DNA-binding NtrC family response regulator